MACHIKMYDRLHIGEGMIQANDGQIMDLPVPKYGTQTVWTQHFAKWYLQRMSVVLVSTSSHNLNHWWIMVCALLSTTFHTYLLAMSRHLHSAHLASVTISDFPQIPTD